MHLNVRLLLLRLLFLSILGFLLLDCFSEQIRQHVLLGELCEYSEDGWDVVVTATFVFRFPVGLAFFFLYNLSLLELDASCHLSEACFQCLFRLWNKLKDLFLDTLVFAKVSCSSSNILWELFSKLLRNPALEKVETFTLRIHLLNLVSNDGEQVEFDFVLGILLDARLDLITCFGNPILCSAFSI